MLVGIHSERVSRGDSIKSRNTMDSFVTAIKTSTSIFSVKQVVDRPLEQNQSTTVKAAETVKPTALTALRKPSQKLG